MADQKYLLDIRGLKKYYPVPHSSPFLPQKYARAVDGVNLRVREGTTLGIVGESGCGKTTVGRMIVGLTEISSGQILYRGDNILSAKGKFRNELHRKVQFVFQDPYASLNPKMRVREILVEPLLLYKKATRSELDAKVGALLEMVGLPKEAADKYPHEFSGGQRQRIGIARALSIEPELVVCDEPVSALDVSIQSQILNLLGDLQKRLGFTYIFIAHGLNVIKHISDDVAVMYQGKIVESAEAEELFARPLHPYTKALINAIPVPDPEQLLGSEGLEGDPPSIVDVTPRCNFCTRCPLAEERCFREIPETTLMGKDHMVACHFAAQL